MRSRSLIIAEAGVNHNGSIERALALVDAAADAGADVVKFQTFKAAQLVTAKAEKARYQTANTGSGGSQLQMLQGLELSVDDHHALIARAAERGIQFMTTAFDAHSLAFVVSLDVPAIKIPSGDITCAPLLLQAARARKPLIVSTGMSTLSEIEQALGVIAFGLITDGEPSGAKDFEHAFIDEASTKLLEKFVTLLHCVTEYPAAPDMVNLRAMDSMLAAFGLPVGYSDHTLGIEVPIAAVARGAKVIEKHFTLDRRLPGPDHLASLEPSELAQMVKAIRNVEDALGSTRKNPVLAEMKNRPIARRSIVAARPIQQGEVLRAEMLTTKRPGTGLSPMSLWDILGTRAVRDFSVDEAIELK